MTWLTNDILDNEIIPNEFCYTIYRKDRDRGYGGVMIAVSKDILSSPIPDLVTSLSSYVAKNIKVSSN